MNSEEQVFHARSRRSDMLPTAVFPITFVALLVVERLAPGRSQPPIRGWLWKGLIFFAISGAINTLVPAAVAAGLAGRAPLALDRLPVAAGAAICFVATDLVHYVRHWLLHRIPGLWRIHQMHHSAERVDVAGALFSHPLDLALTAATTTVVAAVLGVAPLAAGIAGYLGFATSLFLHLDLRTPRWLGVAILRPEHHAVHHARGVHGHNYGTLSLWDRLFGTLCEPAAIADSGFWDGASRRLGAMLLGRDIASAPPPPGPRDLGIPPPGCIPR